MRTRKKSIECALLEVSKLVEAAKDVKRQREAAGLPKPEQKIQEFWEERCKLNPPCLKKMTPILGDSELPDRMEALEIAPPNVKIS